jgi:hypothetical protein
MHRLWLGLVGVAAVVACSGGDDDRAPAMPDETGGSSQGGTRVRPGTGGDEATAGAQKGGAPGSAQGGAGGDDGGLVFEGAGAPPAAPPAVCDPEQMEFGEDEDQLTDGSGLTLLAMTPDELSVVFTTGSDATLALHVADREAAGEDFTTLDVTLPDGYVASRGASLASDGKTLVLVLADHSGFGEIQRSGRGKAFGAEPDSAPYAKINAQNAMSGRELGWPVLSSDAKTLYFVSHFGQALVVQSARGGDGIFEQGTEIDEYTLGGREGEYKLINGLATDQRAIFFFDQATQHAGALFRSRPGSPFYTPLDLGARRGVSPNQDCTRLYSSVSGKLVAQSRE